MLNSKNLVSSRTDARPVRVSIADQAGVASPQGQHLTPIIYSSTAPVQSIAAGHVFMPAGHLARAHVHHNTEIIVYVLEGIAATLWGEEMEPLIHGPGSMIWVPAGVPHTAINLSETMPVKALEIRTDPAFNDDVELLPHLDDVAASRVGALRDEQVVALARQQEAPAFLPDGLRHFA